MSTTGCIGYIDQSGNYRATEIDADMNPENVSRVFAEMFGHVTVTELIQWVERGIAGGGYDGLYNHETKAERGEAKGPSLIDADNYDYYLDYAYIVTDGKISFFDPKNVMDYNDEWLYV